MNHWDFGIKAVEWPGDSVPTKNRSPRKFVWDTEQQKWVKHDAVIHRKVRAKHVVASVRHDAWSPKEIDFIVANYPSLGAVGCAKHLPNRSVGAIWAKAISIGIRCLKKK